MEPHQRTDPTEICSRVGLFSPFGKSRLTLDRLQQLLRQNADAIANSIVLEQGKTLAGMTFWSPFVISHLCPRRTR